MKKFFFLILSLYFTIFLTSCVPCTRCENFVDEYWMRCIGTNAQAWLVGADSWFMTGEPNQIENGNMAAPDERAISMTRVRVPDFYHIVSNGSYQLQLVGNQSHDSVSISGPIANAHKVTASFSNRTLYIKEVKDPDEEPSYKPSNVIVRIGVKQLATVINRGSGNIYGKGIISNNLRIISSGSGNIFLRGKMNIRSIKESGSGSVIIFGDYSPNLDITVSGVGNVGVCGRVGIRSIKHVGMGKIKIIGADTDSLSIYASGYGMTSIAGRVNLKQINALDHSSVYLNSVNSCSINVCASECARIGIAGTTQQLSVCLRGASQFMGRYLRTGTVFVKTNDQSHANITASNNFHSVAAQRSSIYSFGTPLHVSKFSDNTGVIIFL